MIEHQQPLPTQAASTNALVDNSGVHMFSWFQRLLPQKGDFFGMFEAHAATLVGAAEALEEIAADGATPQQLLLKIHDHEHRADDIIREVLTAVRKTFLTPFDRGAITALIGSMDDAIDEMLAAARAIDVYDLRELRSEMKQIVQLISEAAAVTSEAVPLLRDVSSNGNKLHQLTGRLVALEGEADDIHAAGLKRAFQEIAPTSPLQFAVAREVFKNLERVTDAFEDVANQIDGIVIDHA
jgi:predicted phosphate transport protein (TIGR00153 family)